LTKLGIDPPGRVADGDQDAEYTSSRSEEIPSYFRLYVQGTLKRVNDGRGHAAGDSVLAALGALLSEQVRSYDVRTRWGGDELVVALTGANAAEALAVSLLQGSVSSGHPPGCHRPWGGWSRRRSGR
jgi:GGDEF domain-containing protein